MFRRTALPAAVCLGVAGAFWAAEASEPGKTQPRRAKPDCSYGTALQWEQSQEAAANEADLSGKLLMVLAVAGHFEDPFFT